MDYLVPLGPSDGVGCVKRTRADAPRMTKAFGVSRASARVRLTQPTITGSTCLRNDLPLRGRLVLFVLGCGRLNKPVLIPFLQFLVERNQAGRVMVETCRYLTPHGPNLLNHGIILIRLHRFLPAVRAASPKAAHRGQAWR